MYINTQIVRALMALRRIDASTLANIANVSAPLLDRWLYDNSDSAEQLVAFEVQLEILRVLGINGETLRSDIVHYWSIHEELFSRSSRNYWALDVMTGAFGKAEAVYFARDADPMVSLQSEAHFGLQFPSFKAVLCVTTHPLRNVGFAPGQGKNLQWAEGNFGVLVDESKFAQLSPGLMTVPLFNSQLSIAKEQVAWERLGLLARNSNIPTDQIEHLLLTVKKGLQTPKLTEAVDASKVETLTQESKRPTAAEAVTQASVPAATAASSAVRPDFAETVMHIDTHRAPAEPVAVEAAVPAALRPFGPDSEHLLPRRTRMRPPALSVRRPHPGTSNGQR